MRDSVNSARGSRRLGVNLMDVDSWAGGSFSVVLQAASRADVLGVDLLVLPDHVALSEAEHGDKEGFPYPLAVNWFEPVAALGAIAAVTKRAKISTNILLGPMRPTILLAKQLATLDVVSGGRLEAALGVGWQRAEFEAAGMPFDGRYGVLEEQVRACRELWRAAPACFRGRHVTFEDLHSRPMPLQREDVPVLLGLALTPRNVERIVRLGAGWAPAPMALDEFREGLGRLYAECDRVGRPRDDLQVRAAACLWPHGTDVNAGLVPHPLEEVRALWRAGADTVLVHPAVFCSSPSDLAGFLEPMLSARQEQ